MILLQRNLTQYFDNLDDVTNVTILVRIRMGPAAGQNFLIAGSLSYPPAIISVLSESCEFSLL